MFIARKSTKRSYGYELYWTGEEKLSWLIDGRTCSWYKHKKEAENRAIVLNKTASEVK